MHAEIENRMVVDSEWESDIEPRDAVRCGCGRELYSGENCWLINGSIYCNKCVSEAVEDFLFEHRKVVE